MKTIATVLSFLFCKMDVNGPAIQLSNSSAEYDNTSVNIIVWIIVYIIGFNAFFTISIILYVSKF